MLSDLVNRSQPLRADARVLVLGGGYSGGHVARLLRALGTTVRCSRRHLDGSEADLKRKKKNTIEKKQKFIN